MFSHRTVPYCLLPSFKGLIRSIDAVLSIMCRSPLFIEMVVHYITSVHIHCGATINLIHGLCTMHAFSLSLSLSPSISLSLSFCLLTFSKYILRLYVSVWFVSIRQVANNSILWDSSAAQLNSQLLSNVASSEAQGLADVRQFLKGRREGQLLLQLVLPSAESTQMRLYRDGTWIFRPAYWSISLHMSPQIFTPFFLRKIKLRSFKACYRSPVADSLLYNFSLRLLYISLSYAWFYCRHHYTCCLSSFVYVFFPLGCLHVCACTCVTV